MTDFATSYFKCPKCGHDVFTSYPQTQTVGARKRTWEYTCTRCGCTTAIKEVDWRKSE